MLPPRTSSGRILVGIISLTAIAAVVLATTSNRSLNSNEGLKERSLRVFAPITNFVNSIGASLCHGRKLRALLHPDKTRRKSKIIRLNSKKQVSHDSYVFNFGFKAFEDGDDVIREQDIVAGIPVGNHVTLLAEIIDDKYISRPYTPISPPDQTGSIDFLIKVYPNGLFSSYINNLSIGDTLEMRGPFGRIHYLGNQTFEINRKLLVIKHAIFIAGGSGITPCYSVILDSINRDDNLKMSLIYGNRTRDDILLDETLKRMSHESNGRFDYYRTVTTPSDGWTQGVGPVTREMIRKMISEEEKPEDLGFFICGPPGMNSALSQNIKDMDYENVFLF